MRPVRAAFGLLLVLTLAVPGASPVVAQDDEADDYRPDLQVAGTDKQMPNRARFIKPDDFVGDDVYEAPLEGADGEEEDAELEQAVTAEVANGKHIYILKVENDGAQPDTYRLFYDNGSNEPGYNTRLFLASEERNNRVKKGRAVDKPATSEDGYVFDLYPQGSDEGPSQQLFWLELKIRAGFPQEGRVEEFAFLVESLGGQDASSRVSSMVDRMLQSGDSGAVDYSIIVVGERVEDPGDDDGDGDGGGDGRDEIDTSLIRITDPTAANVFAWPITRDLQVQTFASGNQTWNAAAVAGWIGVDFFNQGTPIGGNMWFVRRVGNEWQAAPLEWIFQGMTRQFMTEQIIRDHTTLGSGWNGWAPRPGEELGFLLTTPSWGGSRSPSGMQRTPVVMVHWGCQGNC